MTKVVPSTVPVSEGSNGDHRATLHSSVVKRSIIRDGHKSSVSLEDQFWDSLRELADEANVPLGKLVEQIDEGRKHANLSSAIRLFVLEHFQSQSARRETLDALKRPPSVVSERLRSV